MCTFAPLIQFLEFMASSKDFEKIWESYQHLIKTKDVSIADYCQRNGIVYSQFLGWYKKHISGVSLVPVSDSTRQPEPPLAFDEEPVPVRRPSANGAAKVKFVKIELSNGLTFYQNHIDYGHLKLLVEKLEALC